MITLKNKHAVLKLSSNNPKHRIERKGRQFFSEEILETRKRRKCSHVANELINNNLGIVYAICNKYAKNGVPTKDTDQFADGMVGLTKAAQTYDRTVGEFSTWAWNIVKKEIWKGHRDRSSAKRKIPAVNFHSKDDVNYFEDSNVDSPLDKLFDEENSLILKTMFAPHVDDTEVVTTNKKILWDHYHVGISWQEIGDRFGITRCAAMQRGQSAISILRTRFKNLMNHMD